MDSDQPFLPESSATVSVSNWTSSVLFKMQQEQLMCDTVLRSSDNVLFHAHSCVLSSASPVLHSTLQTAPSKRGYYLSIVAKASVVHLLMDFLYKGNIKVNTCELPSLHTISLYLGIEQLTALIQSLIFKNSDFVSFEEQPLSQLVKLEDSATCQSLEEDVSRPLQKEKKDEKEGDAEVDITDMAFVKEEETDGEEEDKQEVENTECDDSGPADNFRTEEKGSHAMLNDGQRESVPTKTNLVTDKIFLVSDSHRYTCQDCSKRFRKEEALCRHKPYCKGEDTFPSSKPFLCSKCNRSFKKESMLKKHTLQMHSDLKLFNCTQCADSFATREQLNLHLLHKVHDKSEMTLECPNCSRKFAHRNSLNMHLAHCSPEKAFCVICEKTFFNKTKLKTHMVCHSTERPHQCLVCNKTYKTKAALRVHSQLHLQTRSYCCSYCGQTFPQAASLYTHEKKHTDEKTLACDICGKKFYFQSQLRNHSIAHNTQRTQVCSECGKTFKTASDLAVHQRIHKGEYPFSCQYCGKPFTTQGPCKAHERLHTGDKPFACEFCPKKFAHSATWRSHSLIHKGLKPYTCSSCGMSFRKRDHLKTHLRSKHSEKAKDDPSYPMYINISPR